MQTKTERPTQKHSETVVFDEYDFGQPEVYSCELGNGLVLHFREPIGSDLNKINEYIDKSENDVDAFLKIACLLHEPEQGKSKLLLKNAMKMRSKQIGLVVKTLRPLISFSQDTQDDNKSYDNEEL